MLEVLPYGCFVGDNGNQNDTIDVRTCSNALCTRSDLHDNGSCSDYWEHHCCSPALVQSVNVSCEGFSYTISKVMSCECKPCSYKTVVTGRAFGRKDGKEIPLKLGSVVIGERIQTYTSMEGVFKFEVSKGVKRIVVTFYDLVFKELATVTKVFTVNVGAETYVTAILPLKHPSIPFDSLNGTEIHLGDDIPDAPPLASLSIPPDSFVTSTGKRHQGNVNISLQVMDPRKRDDLDAANGEFESEAPDGSKVPLVTYGVVDISLSDYYGNPISLTKPMKLSLDAQLFNIPRDENDEPEISLWIYDINKGTWLEVSRLVSETGVQGRRRLLQSSGRYAIEFLPQPPGPLELYTTTTERIDTGTRLSCNLDRRIPVYEYVTHQNPKGGACYAAVSLYKDLSLKEIYTERDFEIVSYVQEMYDMNYLGSTNTKTISKNGRACIPIFCDKRVYIFVTRNGNERFYPGEHSLPFSQYIRNTSNNEIVFESRHIGNSASIKGPVYKLVDKTQCLNGRALDNTYQFKFAPFAAAPVISRKVSNIKQYTERLSWYPVPYDSPNLRSCFIKVAIKVSIDWFTL